MPSWVLHKKWAQRLGLNSKISSKMDRLIDEEKPHDIGRVPDLQHICQNLSYIAEGRVKQLSELIEKEFSPSNIVQAFKAAALHHLLDVIVYRIGKYGYNKLPPPKTLITESRRQIVENMTEDEQLALAKTSPKNKKLFCSSLDEMVRELHNRAKKVISDMKGYLKEQNGPMVGPWAITPLLNEVKRKNDLYGIFRVNRRPLPLAAAAQKIHSLLRKGRSLTLQMGRRHKSLGFLKVEADTIEELAKKLQEYI